MKTAKNNLTKKREPRNLGVMVISGAFTLLFGPLAFYLLTGTKDQIGYGIAVGFLALVCFGVFVYGRKSVFKIVVELFGWIG